MSKDIISGAFNINNVALHQLARLSLSGQQEGQGGGGDEHGEIQQVVGKSGVVYEQKKVSDANLGTRDVIIGPAQS